MNKLRKVIALIKHYKGIIDTIVNANNMILYNANRKALKNRVNLHYWLSGETTNAIHNLGDELSPIIVDYVLKLKGLSITNAVRGKKHLYALGSIIQFGYQNTTIWGSGFLEKEPFLKKNLFQRWPLRRLDVRAVRGPLTRERLLQFGHNCPEIYGDPGILMPLIYKPKVEISKEYMIIPHFTKDSYYIDKYGKENVISMISDDYKNVIDQICSCKKIISSSLHGIILAEAYGIPAVFLKDRPSFKDFKYLDYYFSTNRFDIKIADSAEEAISIEPMRLPSDIEKMQQNLIAAFPYDLWNY